MKVLSIMQPWATLLCMGAKKIETRSFDTKYRGPLLIHASATRINRKMTADLQKNPLFNKYVPDIGNLPRGVIIGKVNLDECKTIQDIRKGWDFKKTFGPEWEEFCFGDYSAGRRGWIMSKPELFATPVEAKGQLGIWETRNKRAFEHKNGHIYYHGQIALANVLTTMAFEVYVNMCLEIPPFKKSSFYEAQLLKIEENLFNLPF